MCYHCVSSQIFFTFTFSFLFREEDVSYTYHQYEDSSSLIHSDIRVALNHHSTHHQGRRRRKQQRNLVHTFRVIQRQSFFRNCQVQELFINQSLTNTHVRVRGSIFIRVRCFTRNFLDQIFRSTVNSSLDSIGHFDAFGQQLRQ